ncbi:hypothetical protein L204_102236 [Cryptococcus depauperatus]|nr:dimethylaniline monooxygenase [Cryptococcus depauperatus CBS 7855]
MNFPTRTSTLIIGGGPAGLVSLKYAIEYGQPWLKGEEPILVEMKEEIGGTFRWRSYENAELVSSKQLTCFSDFRYPMENTDHPSLPNFVQYLNDYVDHFDVRQYIHTSMKLVSLDYTSKESTQPYKHQATLQKLDSDGISLGDPIVIVAARVVVTTGLHVTPNIPSIPGLNSPPSTQPMPKYLHSSSYKSRSQLAGKDVLVLGCGETGMDIGYEAVMAGADSVWIGVRTGFLSFPKVLNNFRVLGTTFKGNLPIDGLITNLFETAYVHPYISSTHLRWFISDYIVKKVLWFLTGTSAGCNQWAGELPPERQGRAYAFLNKSAKAMQFINRPFYNLSWTHRLVAHYIDSPPPVHDPKIDIVPFPTHFDEGRAVFPAPPEHRKKELAWKEECRPDLVVFCTGYKQEWEWLGKGYPKGPNDCEIRQVCTEKDLSIAFIGFVRPGVGAIPPIAEMQAQLFFLLSSSLKPIPIPTSLENYHLLHSPDSRIQYGVDYSTYMSTLAKDMGSAPGLWELWVEYGWFITFIYCFGAAFPTFYRLVGPYKCSKAKEIVETELWETITRRGLLGNLFMGVIPMLFYALLNLLAYGFEIGWSLTASFLGLPLSPLQILEKRKG